MIGVFGANMGQMQVPVTLLLVSLVVLLTAIVQPYGNANWGPAFHRLEILSLIGLFMTLWAALAFAAYPRCKIAEADGAAAELPWCVFLSVLVGCLDVGIVAGVGAAGLVVFGGAWFLAARSRASSGAAVSINPAYGGGGDSDDELFILHDDL